MELLKITFEISGEKIIVESDLKSLDSSIEKVKSIAKTILKENKKNGIGTDETSASEVKTKKRGRKPGSKNKRRTAIAASKPAAKAEKKVPGKRGRKPKAASETKAATSKKSAVKTAGAKRGRKPKAVSKPKATKAKSNNKSKAEPTTEAATATA